jgi:toxin FitB
VTLAELLCGIGALPTGKRKNMLTKALDGLMGLFRDRVLPFDTDAARHHALLAVTAKVAGRGFPTPDGYVAAIAASRGFIGASRDTAACTAARVAVINRWEAYSHQPRLTPAFRPPTSIRLLGSLKFARKTKFFWL